MSDTNAKKMVKTGKNLGHYMQNQFFARDSPQAGQLPITLPSLTHVIDTFMKGKALLETDL